MNNANSSQLGIIEQYKLKLVSASKAKLSYLVAY